MSTIQNLTSPLRDLWARATSTSTSATPPSTAVDPAIRYDRAVECLPNPSVALPSLVAKMDPVGAKLDRLQNTLRGPYVVNGATVYSGAQFRMVGGFNENAVKPGGPECARLQAVAARAGLSGELYSLQTGRGDPLALKKLTQALIDAGELPKKSSATLPNQIHDMQWRFGVGCDCAGYVYQAVRAIHGDPAKLGLKPAGFENFTGLPTNPCFARQTPATARAGDLIVLASRGHGDPGHNLIVRSHATGTGSDAGLERWPGAIAFSRRAGPVHVFEVDSSFGANASGDPDGGVRRDVLLYDEASKEWCSCKSTCPPAATIGTVPYDEGALTGFYRPKGVR